MVGLLLGFGAVALLLGGLAFGFWCVECCLVDFCVLPVVVFMYVW